MSCHECIACYLLCTDFLKLCVECCAGSPRDTPKRNTGSIHGVDVNQSEDTGSQKVRKAKLLYERDQHAAIVRQRSRICYQLHCKVLGTSTGALQLVLIGLVIRHGWNRCKHSPASSQHCCLHGTRQTYSSALTNSSQNAQRIVPAFFANER